MTTERTFTKAEVVAALDKEWNRTLADFKCHDINMAEAFAARLALCHVADALGVTDAYIASAIKPRKTEEAGE